jgi:hypothetical protein
MFKWLVFSLAVGPSTSKGPSWLPSDFFFFSECPCRQCNLNESVPTTHDTIFSPERPKGTGLYPSGIVKTHESTSEPIASPRDKWRWGWLSSPPNSGGTFQSLEWMNKNITRNKHLKWKQNAEHYHNRCDDRQGWKLITKRVSGVRENEWSTGQLCCILAFLRCFTADFISYQWNNC